MAATPQRTASSSRPASAATAAALDASILDDFLLEQCVVPLLRNVPFWRQATTAKSSSFFHNNAGLLAVVLIRCCTLWITRGCLPGSRALGLRIDYQNNRWRLAYYSFLRCALPVLHRLLIEYNGAPPKMGPRKSNTHRHTSVEQMRALHRRKYVMLWIEKLVERAVPAMRWLAWTTAVWSRYYLVVVDDDDDDERSKRILISPELEMRLSGLSYEPIAATTTALHTPPLNCAYGQRRWMWEILVRSVQLHAAGLVDIRQIGTIFWNHPLLVRLRTTGLLRQLRGGIHVDDDDDDSERRHKSCQKCGRSPINAVTVTYHGKSVYECYLCSSKKKV